MNVEGFVTMVHAVNPSSGVLNRLAGYCDAVRFRLAELPLSIVVLLPLSVLLRKHSFSKLFFFRPPSSLTGA